jgi:dTDP-4-amino-4,6-dideoxygalactose transaminase
VPNTVRETSRVISLPLHRSLTLGEVDRICDSVRSFLT